MIVSVNWLKKYVDIDMPIDELAVLIGARLVEIEGVENIADKYKDVVIAKVVTCEKLEGSDHLSVTKIDDGGRVQDVERDENGLVQVVCGAPNVRAGLLVAWLPPKSVVPETFGSDDPFVLGARKMLGVTSNGMLASAKELDLYEDHSGIIELADAGVDSVTPGKSFAELYDLNDTLLDIENKSLTHRPDAFGVIGFAREIAGISGKQFETPEFLKNLNPQIDGDGSIDAPTVSIDDPTLSDRYQMIVLGDAREDAQSPFEIQSYLARVGMRPISAVVDVTNYLMLASGQRLHAFDYDKLVAVAGGRTDVHVRAGRDGEKLELLDGRTIELSPEDIVIAAGDTAIGLAGAMGGASTEIDEHTTRIALESATFNLYKLRSTQMRHGIFSEAITRFTKGQPAELTAPVLAEAVRLMGEWAGARPLTSIVEAYPDPRTIEPIEVSVHTVNAVLGSEYTREQIAETLERVEFDVRGDDENLRITAPYWRADIHIAEDIIEEIGRLNGFDNIAPTLPSRTFKAVSPSGFDALRAKIRKVLVRAGANEVLTYSFVHGDVLARALQVPENSYRITNSISPDLQYYRQSLTPSLLGLVHPNIKSGFDEFALFELNKVHRKNDGVTDENVPVEKNHVGFVVAAKKSDAGASYYRAKYFVEYLLKELGITAWYEPFTAEDATETIFEPKRAARIVAENITLGVVGEYKLSARQSFKLPDVAAGFELDTNVLYELSKKAPLIYEPLSRYPGTERDVCFQVAGAISYEQVYDAAAEALAELKLDTTLEPIDLYQPENADVKNITVRIGLTSQNQTLTAETANTLTSKVSAHVAQKLDATII